MVLALRDWGAGLVIQPSHHCGRPHCAICDCLGNPLRSRRLTDVAAGDVACRSGESADPSAGCSSATPTFNAIDADGGTTDHLERALRALV
mgnify:FL=1